MVAPILVTHFYTQYHEVLMYELAYQRNITEIFIITYDRCFYTERQRRARSLWTYRSETRHVDKAVFCVDVNKMNDFVASLSFMLHAYDLEALASDRDIWGTVCGTGLRSFLNGWITTSEERRTARHTGSTKPKTGPRCPQSSRVCASDFALRSHTRSHDKTGNTQ